MNPKIELLVMQLKSEAEEIYLSRECKENVIRETVKSALIQNLKEDKISSTEYQEALDILKRYEIN
ncbi:MAG: hypothetical protein ACI4VH_04705 [Clostridia bacterium]